MGEFVNLMYIYFTVTPLYNKEEPAETGHLKIYILSTLEN